MSLVNAHASNACVIPKSNLPARDECKSLSRRRICHDYSRCSIVFQVQPEWRKRLVLQVYGPYDTDPRTVWSLVSLNGSGLYAYDPQRKFPIVAFTVSIGHILMASFQPVTYNFCRKKKPLVIGHSLWLRVSQWEPLLQQRLLAALSLAMPFHCLCICLSPSLPWTTAI